MDITKKRFSVIKPVGFLVLAVAAFAFGWNYLQKTTNAADLSKFDPGNIMSDSVMSNKSALGVQQIQAFLESKNACNNTNTYMASWYPELRYSIRDGKFICMAKESFDGESAAQIIWQISQDYNINPQVLIVLLEKEQGLVSDTWPNHIQYERATGYGCPDTAVCDSQYFGLKNQLRQAAILFRNVLNGGWSNYPVGQTYVQYHPNSWCGGKVVNIQNRATSALYRYTPYQPNASALAAGYGLGDACGAYGNRNFYGLFTDWFGSTQEIKWQKMDEPRWMQMKYDSRKTNLVNQDAIDDILTKGRQIRFTNKITVGDMTYLRSEWDSRHNYNKGILLDDLEEIPFEPIENPRWMSIACDGLSKKIPNSGTSQPSSYPRGLIAKFTTKTLVNGIWYLRTETDTNLSNNLGFPINCVDVSEPTNTIPFDRPRELYIPTGSTFVNVRDNNQNYKTKSNLSSYFTNKFHFNGVWYYQTKDDFYKNNLTGVASNDVKENVSLIPMDSPRKLSLIIDTKKTDLLLEAQVGETVPKNTSRFFIDKYIIRGEWYLRTQSDFDDNYQLGIPLKLLQ